MKSRLLASQTIPLVAVLVVVADQLTKHMVRGRLRPGQSLSLASWLSPVLQITYVTNSGAAFGLFPNGSLVLIGVAVVVIVALLWYYLQWSGGRWLVQLALGLQLGGAIGNLIDRLRFGGAVVDFIDLNFWPLRRWPVFNIADASIVTGVIALTVLMLWDDWQEGQTNRQLAPARDE